MFCSHCGKENHGNAAFCSGCGAKIAAEAAPGAPPPAMPAISAPPGMPGSGDFSDKSKLVAALLAFFLGWLGVHRFYLGHMTIGVVQLVLGVFTCGLISWVWGIVDLIMILTGSLKDAQGRTLKD